MLRIIGKNIFSKPGIKFLGFILWLFSVTVAVHAQDPITIHKLFGGSAQFGYTYTLPTIPLKHKLEDARLYIKFYLGEEFYNLGEYDFGSFELSFNYARKNAAGETLNTGSRSITLTTNEVEKWIVMDAKSWVEDVTTIAFSSVIVNSDINSSDFTPEVYDHITNNLYIQIQMVTDYSTGITMPSGGPAPVLVPASPVQAVFNASGESDRRVTFTWSSNGMPFPNYQFQIVRLFNKKITTTTEEELYTDIDWSKATTIETESSETSLTLSIAGGTGYYAWRVRPIGNYYEGGIANEMNLGEWFQLNCEQAPMGEEYQIYLASIYDMETNMGPMDAVFFFNEPEEDKNWIYSRTFTEGNKISESMTYATGLNYVRQSQKYLPSQSTTVITQDVIDNSGRSVLKTLPVPVDDDLTEGLPGYQKNFVQNESDHLYSADDFDTDENFKNPGKVAENQYFSYYSGIKELVPDAEQYAYTRILYYNDGSGRVREQSLAGRTHAIGTGGPDEGGGKTTRYYYGSPSEMELITLFGNEAPDAESVLKTITVDPNGTATVSYTSKSGQLLATALMTKTDEGLYAENNALLPLDELYENPNELPVNRLTINTKDGLRGTKRLALPMDTEIDINYTFSSMEIINDELEIPCTSGGSCSFMLYISIYNLNGIDPAPFVTFSQSINSDYTGEVIPIVTDYLLEAGNWLIVKELGPGIDPKVYGQEVAYDLKKRVEPVSNVIQYWLGNVKNDTELNDFYDKAVNFTSNIGLEECAFFSQLINDGTITGCSSIDLLTDLYIEDITIDRDAVTNRPIRLNIISDCFPITLDLDYQPSYECLEEGDDDSYPGTHFGVGQYSDADPLNGKMDFEGYMQYVAEVSASDYPVMLPGFTVGDFNKMIHDMITKAYDIHDGEGEKVQYTCDELWKAWINTINTYADAVSSLGGRQTVGSKVDPDHEEDNTQGDDYDDHYDNNFETGNFLTNWLGNRKISNKMRDFDNRGFAPAITMNLVTLFLDNVGCKFAHVITPAQPPLLQDDDYDAEKSIEVVLNDQNEYEMVYPYCVDPIYAYKYYVYDDDFDDAVDPYTSASFKPYITRKEGCENMYCFHDLSLISNCPFLQTLCTSDYFIWTNEEINDFYNCIKQASTILDKSTDPPLITDCDQINSSTDPQVNPTDICTRRQEECNSFCLDQEDKYRQKLINMFQAAGFFIDGCPDDEHVITMDLINEAVQLLIAQCQGQCTIDVAKCMCERIEICQHEGEDVYVPIVTLLSDEEEIRLQKVMKGNLLIDLEIDGIRLSEWSFDELPPTGTGNDDEHTDVMEFDMVRPNN